MVSHSIRWLRAPPSPPRHMDLAESLNVILMMMVTRGPPQHTISAPHHIRIQNLLEFRSRGLSACTLANRRDQRHTSLQEGVGAAGLAHNRRMPPTP